MNSMLRLGVVVAISLTTQAARAGEQDSSMRATVSTAHSVASAPGYDAFHKMDAATSHGTAEMETAKAIAAGDAIGSASKGAASAGEGTQPEAFAQRTWLDVAK